MMRCTGSMRRLFGAARILFSLLCCRPCSCCSFCVFSRFLLRPLLRVAVNARPLGFHFCDSRQPCWRGFFYCGNIVFKSRYLLLFV